MLVPKMLLQEHFLWVGSVPQHEGSWEHKALTSLGSRTEPASADTKDVQGATGDFLGLTGECGSFLHGP